MKIRAAIPQDSDAISLLAYESKAHWNYSEAFLQACKADLTVSAEFIKKNPVYVVEDNCELLAFYGFCVREQKLDTLFIRPTYIGHGLGKLLWAHILETAKHQGMIEFTLDADPHAEGFYQKMGATTIGRIASSVDPQRLLPLMKVIVP
ncbi:N-acetyltransferase family protein [Paenalcaligenes sp. Me52]|uniref:GNAT family N-acetyltransferase n=1 Tax=Paenalcaligenes sp. Me52 TaxID=3392038 RepID=UPI003D2BA434